MISLYKNWRDYRWAVASALIKSALVVEEILNMMSAGWGFTDWI